MWPFCPRRGTSRHNSRRDAGRKVSRDNSRDTGRDNSRDTSRDTSRDNNISSGARLGRRGEKLAARYLRRAGMRILARNYRCPAGEADIIALEPTGEGSLVFVEVKTRSGRAYTEPESAVNAEKRRRLRGIARYYLSTHRTGQLAVRFDVIAIVIPPGGRAEIRHIPQAFA